MIWEVPVEFLGKAPDTAMDLAHMAIDHPGDSSLLSLMKKDDLANDVVVDYWKIEKEHVLFLIELGLTKKGVRQLDDVVARVFSVLSKLKNERMPEYLFDELYLRKKITSSYTTPCDSYNFVIDAVSDIMDFGIESYPNSFLLSSKYDPESYQHFFDSLKAEKCLFFLVAPQKESGVKPTAVEKWMGTEYLVRPINESKLKYWSSIEPDAEVEFCPALPPENQQHDIFDIDEDIQNSISVYKTEAASIHLSTNKDNPETGIGAWFCFSSPQALANVKNSSLASIFVYYIEEKLKEYIPKHLQELLSWSVYPSDKGICVILDVFGENIEESLSEFFSCFTNIPIDEELFEKVKQDFIDSYNGDPEPIELAQITAESIIMSNPVIFSDIYAHFPALELEDFKEFVSTVFNSNIRVQGLFYGNLSRQETLNYWKIVESCFQDSTFLIDYNDPLIDQFQELSWDSPKVVEKTTHRKGNALVLVLNVGALQRENWAAQKIVSQLVQEEFFEELRTRQQTAYKLYSWGDAFHDKLLQFFAIQSSSHNPRDLLERTEAFLNDFAKNFQTKVSKERVALVRYMLITALKKHKKSFLTNEELRYLNASIEKLKSISYEEVQKFVSKAFSSSNTKKIAVLVEGATKKGS
jgi:insulysin